MKTKLVAVLSICLIATVGVHMLRQLILAGAAPSAHPVTEQAVVQAQNPLIPLVTFAAAVPQAEVVGPPVRHNVDTNDIEAFLENAPESVKEHYKKHGLPPVPAADHVPRYPVIMIGPSGELHTNYAVWVGPIPIQYFPNGEIYSNSPIGMIVLSPVVLKHGGAQ
jgi:hypothetical protein